LSFCGPFNFTFANIAKAAAAVPNPNLQLLAFAAINRKQFSK
jgi:hypothetical protein